jgi:hypothetical protein
MMDTVIFDQNLSLSVFLRLGWCCPTGKNNYTETDVVKIKNYEVMMCKMNEN